MGALLRAERLAGRTTTELFAAGCAAMHLASVSGDGPLSARPGEPALHAWFVLVSETGLQAWYSGLRGSPMTAFFRRAALAARTREQFQTSTENLTYVLPAFHPDEATFSIASCFPSEPGLTKVCIFGCGGPGSTALERAVYEWPVVLWARWFQNAGCDVVKEQDKDSASVWVSGGWLDVATIPAGKTVIYVNTEQPLFIVHRDARLGAGVRRADWVWCMDTADATAVVHVFGVPVSRVRILPVTFGTFYEPSSASAGGMFDPFDVLQYGNESPRRQEIVHQLASGGTNIFSTSSLWESARRDTALAAAKVLVVPANYAAPSAVGLHRIAQALRFTDLDLVVEDVAPGSVLTRFLADLLGPILRLVPYDELTTATREALASKTTHSGPRKRVADFARALWTWDGQTSWLRLLG